MASNVQWAVSVSSTDLATQVRANVSKIKVLNNYLGVKELLQVYLAQLKLYIEFNISQFSLNQEKTLFGISCLRNKTFDWIEALLQEFLEKSPQEKRADISVISNYTCYKKEIKKHFGVVNKTQAAEMKCYDQGMIGQNYESALTSMWSKHTQGTWARQGWSAKAVELGNLTTWGTWQVQSVECGEFHPI